jgi:ubiquinone/menaquinone biosynthesis C-methylase UbiE
MISPGTLRSPEVETENAEIVRIRNEYARRKQEIPRDYYSWSRLPNYFTHTQLVRDCIVALTREQMFPLEGRSVADIGCGAGNWLLEFAQWGASDLHGIDLDETRVEQARKRLPATNLYAGDARQLPWPDGSFDLVTQFVLFTSILNENVKKQIANEMLRVVKPGGLILWFDFRFNNPRNRNVRGIEAAEIESLFPDCKIKLQRVSLAPPLARRVVPVSWVAASLLEKLPFLRTHYLGIIRKSKVPA